MGESIPSFTMGSAAGLIATISGIGILETMLLAFISGMIGYLGNLLIKWIIKKLSKKAKNEKF